MTHVPPLPVRIRALVMAAVLPVAGCGPLVQIGGNAPVPASLLTLRAEPPAAVSHGVTLDPARTITVGSFAVPASLQTLRLPVTTADTELKYLATGQWIEQPSRLLQRLLIDRLNAAGVAAVGPRLGLATGRSLTGELREFGLDVRDPARPLIRVRLDVLLSNSGGKGAAASARSRQFVAEEAVAQQTPEAIGRALNTASNRIGGDVAQWAR